MSNDLDAVAIKPDAPKKHRKKTRERLLEAGTRLFSRAGFDGTTISELEQEASLRPGTGGFYRHFSSKEEFLDEVIEFESDRLQENHRRNALTLEGSLGDARADLLLSFRVYLMGMAQVRTFIEILLREQHRLSPVRVAELRKRMLDDPLEERTNYVAALIEKGDVVPLQARALAVVIVNALIGHFLTKRYYAVDSVGGVDDEAFTAALADLVTWPRGGQPKQR